MDCASRARGCTSILDKLHASTVCSVTFANDHGIFLPSWPRYRNRSHAPLTEDICIPTREPSSELEVFWGWNCRGWILFLNRRDIEIFFNSILMLMSLQRFETVYYLATALYLSYGKKRFFFIVILWLLLVGIPKIKRKQIVARFKLHNPIFLAY